MKLVWITDIHLNFVDSATAQRFYRTLAETNADGVVLSGDIGEAPNVAQYLCVLEESLACPIYFVLGNHDFYRSSLAAVRREMDALCMTRKKLVWLTAAGVVPLTRETGLVGHDSWADGRVGDYWHSDVRMSDWRLITEFVGLDAGQRLAFLHRLGDEAAQHFREVLPSALDRFKYILVVTHVPPFREACSYEGRQSSDNWLPHLACEAVGSVLREMAAARPECELTVVCGHTHGAGEAQITPNLHVLTGSARYGHPRLQRILEVK